eukprot:763338-Hanusia_phi.AAC.1
MRACCKRARACSGAEVPGRGRRAGAAPTGRDAMTDKRVSYHLGLRREREQDNEFSQVQIE